MGWHGFPVDPGRAAAYRDAGWWGDATIADRVRHHAATQPSSPAHVSPRGTLTWAGLLSAATRVAGALIAGGVGQGERVAVLLPDGPSIHAVFVGVELAGAVVVGLGHRAGAAEIRHLLDRTGARLLVTFADHRGEHAGEFVESLGVSTPTAHLVVPRFEESPDGAITVDGAVILDRPLDPAELARRGLGPDDLFLVNSTSGTTGLPKIVQHHQNRWVYFHHKAVEHGDLTAQDVFLSAVPAPFGFGIWTAHVTPTILGVPSVAMEHWTAEETLALIERERVTVLCCVSTQFILLLSSPALGDHDLSSLRVMFTGGEAVPYDRALAFEQQTGATVLQFYGSNETGVLSGTRLGDPPERRLRTAGRIVPEMNVRLFDPDDGRDVTASGRGRPGCRGPATSPGYFDDDAANAQLFTPDGWMLMADVCTVDDEGWLTVVGRSSDLIIRGGKNISAPQVEAEVATHPAVSHVAAVAAPDPVFGERVCAVVQLRPGASLTLAELTAHLVARGMTKDLLPEHLVVLDELPTSSGGKIAKGDLRTRITDLLASQSGPS